MAETFNAQLIKNVEERGYRARSEHRITEGRVVAINTETKTVTLDSGVYAPDGTTILFQNIPYQPQSPPKMGDPIFINYANISPHSMRIGGSAISGQNTGGFDIPAVTGLHEGANASLQGQITFISGTNLSVVQAGQTFTFNNTQTLPNSLVILKQTIAYTAINGVAGLTTTYTTPSRLPAGAVVTGYKLKHSTAFAGGAISAITAAVQITVGGISGTATSPVMSVFSAPSGTNLVGGALDIGGNHGAVQNIDLVFTAVGANLTALTAGSLDVWVTYYLGT